MVAPSRAESLPYIVLEAAGARIPLISTNVGGIPEIFGPYSNRLGPADDPDSLCRRMLAMLNSTEAERERDTADLAAYVEGHFSIRTMVDSVLDGYFEAMARRAQRRASTRLSDIPSNA
jgi:glycosyltransferase involved in cell wall biosynthesis